MGTRGAMVFLFTALLLFAGCTRATERVAGWYITRKVDGYLDLTRAQEKAARAHVDAVLHVVRSDELGHWISFLRTVRDGVERGNTEASIAHLQRAYDARLDAGVALVAPHLAALLSELSSEQLDHFAARMHEDVEHVYRERKLPEARRAEAIEERVLDMVEDFVGDLDDAQEARVRTLVHSIPDERPKQYAAAEAHIGRFRAFMSGKPAAADIEAYLLGLWAHRYDALGPGRDKAARRAEQRKVWLELDHMLTPAQRAHASEELSDRIRMAKRFSLSQG